MLTPITANYVPDGDDWKVSVTRADKTLTGRAPGLIAARDTADQLVEKLSPKQDDDSSHAPGAPVVHLLDGDPVAFSTAYLEARHGGPAGSPAEEQTQEADAEQGAAQDDSAAGAPAGTDATGDTDEDEAADQEEAEPEDVPVADVPVQADTERPAETGEQPAGGAKGLPMSQAMGTPIDGADAPAEDTAPPAHAQGG